MTEKSFLRIFSYFGNDDANIILQDIENPNSNLLRGLSANETSSVVKKDCSTFKEFQDRFISRYPTSALPDTAIGLAFRGQASTSAEWRLNSSLFRLLVNLKDRLKLPDNCGTSMKVDRYISLTQELAQKHLNPNGQNLRPDDGYLMAVLQHYRKKSPLLDWTLNVDYALYFAFADAPADKSEKVAIYIADIGKVNKLALHTLNDAGMRYKFNTTLDITLDAVRRAGGWAFFRPADFGDIRFAIQEGVFAWQSCPADLEWHISYPQDNIKSGAKLNTPGTLWIVTLPVSARPDVVKYLADKQITHEKLFAGWDDIGRDIVSKYTDEIIKDPSGIPYATDKQIRDLQSRR